ncbi:hypothetical protein DVH24_041328 [Malus domestica]|uniref:Uncharacterized protein n=1 Tax=Malus domestica TaxID=3750 RepID=A0A498IF73_MALDO|nr:hypothetical protein DVH24_041328 [Malus domestica]
MRMRSVEGEMTKQEAKEPYILVESSKLWLRSLGSEVNRGMGRGMSDPLVALGHPLIELMVGFYTQKVTSKTKWLASLAFKGAQRVTVLPIFARSIEVAYTCFPYIPSFLALSFLSSPINCNVKTDSEAEEQAKVPDCYRPVFDRIQRRYSSASTYDVPKVSLCFPILVACTCFPYLLSFVVLVVSHCFYLYLTLKWNCNVKADSKAEEQPRVQDSPSCG